MNRAINFRAWHKREKRMFEVVGLEWNATDIQPVGKMLLVSRDGRIRTVTGEDTIHDNYIFLQAIGLLDQQGKVMFEGDIIEYLDNTSRGLVKKVGFMEDIRHYLDFTCSKWEKIIGNIYENPELLPEGTISWVGDEAISDY